MFACRIQDTSDKLPPVIPFPTQATFTTLSERLGEDPLGLVLGAEQGYQSDSDSAIPGLCKRILIGFHKSFPPFYQELHFLGY